MGMLDGILNNPIVKTTLLSKLKTFFENDNVKLIAIKLDENGELDFEVHKEDVTIIADDYLSNIMDRLEQSEIVNAFKPEILGGQDNEQ